MAEKKAVSLGREECLFQTSRADAMGKGYLSNGKGVLWVYIGGLGNALARSTCKPAVSLSWNCLSREDCLSLETALSMRVRAGKSC